MNALYRKYNDGRHNSSTYHKKDGTPVREILKEELKKEVSDLLPGEVEHVVDEDFEVAERLPSCGLKQGDYSGVDFDSY